MHYVYSPNRDPSNPYTGGLEVTIWPAEPETPKPQVCAEVWNDTPVDPEKAWEATLAMCGEVRK